MRYLGSKTSLLDDIALIAEEYKRDGIFCDPFGGIGTVGRFMKEKGYQVITGDILYFAHCFQVAMIENNGEVDFMDVKKATGLKSDKDVELYLNELPIKDGWLVEEYAEKRRYFTRDNAMHIQACFECIQQWRCEKLLSDVEYEILSASLIQSFDKVANTAGTYYAYLKEYYRKALRPFVFQLITPHKSKMQCKSFYGSANQLVKTCECDILYLDPPYNERNYGRYYHLPENIAKGRRPLPKGKSGIDAIDFPNSQYNKKVEATKAFKQLVSDCRAGCIIFHYTDKGIIGMEDAKSILEEWGKLEEFYFDSKGYSTVINAEKCQHHILKVIK